MAAGVALMGGFPGLLPGKMYQPSKKKYQHKTDKTMMTATTM